jgi:hypothetical protein
MLTLQESRVNLNLYDNSAVVIASHQHIAQLFARPAHGGCSLPAMKDNN